MSDERDVQQVLAQYVRATDRRDGVTQGALFTADAIIQIFGKIGPDSYQPAGPEMIGGEAVRHAVETLMAPHPVGGSSHHVTADHLITVDGDRAHLNAQFIVFEVRTQTRPEAGWPAGTFMAPNTVRPIESGYYDTDLQRIGGAWKIVRHHVLLDVPTAIGAEIS